MRKWEMFWVVGLTLLVYQIIEIIDLFYDKKYFVSLAVGYRIRAMFIFGLCVIFMLVFSFWTEVEERKQREITERYGKAKKSQENQEV